MFGIHNYLLVCEAAKILGVSKSTIRNWDKKGLIKTRRHPINKYRLYFKEDLEKILKEIQGSNG